MDPSTALEEILTFLVLGAAWVDMEDYVEGLIWWLSYRGFLPRQELLDELHEIDHRFDGEGGSLLPYLKELKNQLKEKEK